MLNRYATMQPRVAILDYGCGNLASVANAVRKVGGEPFIAGRWPTADEAQPTHIILPGQGHFGTAMGGSWQWMAELAKREQRPILGICLGMQLMCEGSEEAPGVLGLGWFPYKVTKLALTSSPHIGWATVRTMIPLISGNFYFCHSYGITVQEINAKRPWQQCHAWTYPNGETPDTLTSNSTILCSGFTADNVWAVQFHPEKSGKAGLVLLERFLAL